MTPILRDEGAKREIGDVEKVRGTKERLNEPVIVLEKRDATMGDLNWIERLKKWRGRGAPAFFYAMTLPPVIM